MKTLKINNMTVLMCLVFFVSSGVSQDYVIIDTLKTPRKNLVPSGNVRLYLTELITQNEYDTQMDLAQDFVDDTLAAFMGVATRKYNCHGYAYSVANGTVDTLEISLYPESFKFWKDGSYNEVSEEHAQKIYYANDHSAVTVATVCLLPGFCVNDTSLKKSGILPKL